MNKLILTFFLSFVFIACNNKDDDNILNDNPFLNIPPVNLSLNLNLPEYNPLRFPGNSVIVHNQGIKGIVVYCITENLYAAFELSDPNHTPNGCSKMEVVAPVATCQCADENKYNIISGEHMPEDPSMYPMQRYRANREGDVVYVYN